MLEKISLDEIKVVKKFTYISNKRNAIFSLSPLYIYKYKEWR